MLHFRLLAAMLLLLCAVLLLCACDPGNMQGIIDSVKGEVSDKVVSVKGEISNLMTTTTVPITTYDPNAPPTPGMQYQKSGDGRGYVVRGYSGKNTDLVIADENMEMPVIGIMQGAFAGKRNLTSIRIPESIISIGKNAFTGCTGLIHSEGGGHYVDHWMVGVGEFVGNVVMREDIVGIADSAFEGRSNLISLTLPAGLQYIGADAFLGCTSLSSIVVPAENPYFTATATALYNKDKTVLIRYFGTGDSFTIPYSVTEIAPSAFRDHKELKTVSLGRGSSLVKIGAYAFAGCTSLVGFSLPAATTRIEEGVFSGCAALTGFRFPDGSACTSIGAEAFRGCASLTEMTIPEGIVEIGQNAFYECTLLNSVTFAETSGWMVGGQDLLPSQISTKPQAAAALCKTYRIKTWVRQIR